MVKKLFILILFFSLSTIVSSTVYKFDFGGGKLKKGYVKVDSNTVYSPEKGYGFDLTKVPESEAFNNNALKGDACFSDGCFFFSVKVPEGNYKVTLIIGNENKPSVTTIRGESRRLFFDKINLKRGEFEEVSFTTNVRYIRIDDKDKVRIKPREKHKLNWDDKLTIEFNGKNPSVCAMIVKKVDVPTVFLCGNSTVVDQDNEPWCGWGQMIPAFFNDKVSFANYAESGEAANSFIGAKRLRKIESKIKPGDYLFVEFGHNDQKQKGPNAGPWKNYTVSLKKFVKVARDHGATPVFVTSMNRRVFDKNGKVVNTLEEYPDAMRVLGKEEKVTVIDLNSMSKVMYEKWGPEGSLKAFVHYPANTFPNQPKPLADNTHFNSYGGYELAKCVLEGIREKLPALAKYILKDAGRFDPAHPDPFDKFSMPPSPFVDIRKPDGN